MQIELKEIPISEVVEGYINDQEEGVIGFSGKLNIRPKYQREFVYKDQQRAAVIETVKKKFPLNVMYWVKITDNRDTDNSDTDDRDRYEVMDGQQRTISICEYVAGNFSLDDNYFHNLQKEEQAEILAYKLMVYFCQGTDKEKLDWFKTINIAGEKLYDQELRNAIYTGPWLTDAKMRFSKSNCPAYGIAHDYMTGSPIRQDYLETVISWLSCGKIEQYMARNQHEPNANELWLYFQNVINWIKVVFPIYRKEIKGLPLGLLYNAFKDKSFDSDKLEEKITRLMQDDEVKKKSGIYQYVLTENQKYLNIRAFTDNQKREAYERQKGICKICKKHFEIDEMEADHIIPWHEGGKTNIDNCQILCKNDNRTKSGK